MPAPANQKRHSHPCHSVTTETTSHRRSPVSTAYAELHCLTNFSFLRGASHPEELVERAAELGYAALAITDRNSLAGVVRAHIAAQHHNLHLIVGAEITPVDAPPVVLLAPDRAAYGRLSRLITRGRLRVKKGQCHLTFDDVAALASGLIAIVTPPRRPVASAADIRHYHAYRELFGHDVYLAAELAYEQPDTERLAWLHALSNQVNIPLVAANDVHYHDAARRYLQDALTCVREKCTIHDAGRRLFPNAQRHLRTLDETGRRYAAHTDLLERTIEIAERCTFSLDELKYEYAHEVCPDDLSPIEYLAQLTWAGAARRYADGIPDKVRDLLTAELKLIEELRYEYYFLTVWDLVRFARGRGILCQGRGSAANSAVCYCLGVTAVDPARIDLLFERFVSKERNEPPDIDVDFEHNRREEVFQYIYRKYGRERAAITAEVITYHARSAVRDIGKALGLSLDRVERMSKMTEWWDNELPTDAIRAAGLNPDNRTVQMVLRLVRQVAGFPRHLSQHVGGFVITETPLCEIVPLLNGAMPGRTFIEWDKDDIDALGILKVDCLALGMLTAISGMFRMMEGTGNGERGTGNRERGTGNGERVVARGGIGDSLVSELERCKYGKHSGLSRSDRLEEGNHVGQDRLQTDKPDARGRTVRTHEPDQACRRLDSEQHCGRQCSSEPKGLHPLPHHSAGFACGIGNAANHSPGTQAAPNSQPTAGSDPRNRAHAPSPDQQATHTPHLAPPATVPRSPFPVPCSPFPVPRSPFPVPCSLSSIPPEDPRVYDMICDADTVGVFQIESRAQMSMLPRLKPRCFYDLVIEVAIVRPGPIQGGMVHPYLRRRDGLEPVWYPDERIKAVLEKTLGVPLFQEQVMKLAVVAANFTPGEADQLRRAMAAWKRHGDLSPFQTRLMKGMLINGYSREFAEAVFKQISGFAEYGFPESHSASFALLVYASCWFKRYHPAAFLAALINAQPLGFYTPAQLVRDALAHGVAVRPVDVNWSGYDCALEGKEATRPRGHEATREQGSKATKQQGSEATRQQGNEAARQRGHEVTRGVPRLCEPCFSRGSTARLTEPWHTHTRDPAGWGAGGPAVRLGMRIVRGLSADKVAGIEAARREGPITSIRQLARRDDVSRETLVRLAAADAFRSLGLDRRQVLWQILALDRQQQSLFADLEPAEQSAKLPAMTLAETVEHDYDALGMSLNAHPIELVREELRRLKVTPNAKLKATRHGRGIRVAGLVTVRQRPMTAKGMVFMTLEDETGMANLIIRPQVWDREGRKTRHKIAVVADGVVERQGKVIHVQVSRLHDLSELVGKVRHSSRDFC